LENINSEFEPYINSASTDSKNTQKKSREGGIDGSVEGSGNTESDELRR